MARPTKFNPDRGRVIVGALLAGQGRRAAVEAAGVGLRTLAEWLAKGRAGDPAVPPNGSARSGGRRGGKPAAV